jgi:hypothetical protein
VLGGYEGSATGNTLRSTPARAPGADTGPFAESGAEQALAMHNAT